jgi:hypothetical protein
MIVDISAKYVAKLVPDVRGRETRKLAAFRGFHAVVEIDP